MIDTNHNLFGHHSRNTIVFFNAKDRTIIIEYRRIFDDTSETRIAKTLRQKHYNVISIELHFWRSYPTVRIDAKITTKFALGLDHSQKMTSQRPRGKENKVLHRPKAAKSSVYAKFESKNFNARFMF